jgi:Protein phosphatase 2C
LRPLVILDAVSLAGDRSKPNEDAIGSNGHMAFVIDGATDLGPPLMPGDSDAAWLARTAAGAFLAAPPDQSPAAMIASAIARLGKAFATERLAEPEGAWHLPYGSCLLLALRDDRIELGWAGDCRGILRLDGVIRTVGEGGDGEARERALAASLAETSGHSSMLRQGPVLAELRRRRSRFAQDDAPAILGIDARHAARIHTISFPRPKRCEALLMTDGFSAMELKYGRYSAEELLSTATEKGLASLAGALRRIEEVEDPEGRLFARFKRSDDASAILLRA